MSPLGNMDDEPLSVDDAIYTAGTPEPHFYPRPESVFEGVRANFALDRIRLLATALRRDKGGFSTEQARAFLLLYGEELQDAIDKTVREFLKEKVG